MRPAIHTLEDYLMPDLQTIHEFFMNETPQADYPFKVQDTSSLLEDDADWETVIK